MKKIISVILFLFPSISAVLAQQYYCQPYYGDNKIRVYNSNNPVAASPAYTVDISADVTNAWGETASGPNDVLFYKNKMFVSFDLGNRGGVLIYNIADVLPTRNANPPIVIKPQTTNGLSSAGIAINPANGDLFIPTFYDGADDSGVYQYTAASNYATGSQFASYFNDASVASICANFAFDASGNLWMTTWTADDKATDHFLICYKGLNKFSYYKITNTATPTYSATDINGHTFNNLNLLSAPEGIAFDPTGNLWIGNNNDFALTNGAGQGTVVKLSSAWISTLLGSPSTGTGAGSPTYTVPSAQANIKYIANGKEGGISFSGNKIYINDQGQNQGSDFTINGTVWQWDITTAFNAANFKASGIHATYPGNGGGAFLPSGIFPAISYSSPNTYSGGKAITPLTPTSSGIAAPAYSSSPVIIGSGFKTPAGVAVDAAGNVYVADKGNNAIKKFVSGGGSAVTLGSGFKTPTGVAVDGAGNVYVADYGNNGVKEIPFLGGAPVTLGGGFSSPTGVAVDKAGNVYVADMGNNAVKEIFAGSTNVVTLGSGFSKPTGVVVDAAGNVYVADQGNNEVKEIPAGNGTPVIIGSGFSAPFGVSADAAGNVYVADLGNNAIKEVPAGGGAPVSIGAGFNQPTGLTVDASGNVYVADQGNNKVKKFKPAGGYYLNTALPAGLIFSGATGVINGTPTALSPATNYTITAYNASGSASAVVSIDVVAPPGPTISYTTPQTYYVSTGIGKLTPASGSVATPAYSGTLLTIGSGFNTPVGVAVDAAGDVFVADTKNNVIKKVPVGNGAPVIVGTGFNQPYGVAVDAAGNLYVADYFNNAVKKIPAGGGATVTIGSGFKTPGGVAVDAAGNVYVGDTGNNAVKKIPAGGGAVVKIGSGFKTPIGVAVDMAGNVYVADYDNSAVKKIAAVGGAVSTLASGFVPVGVAVDAAGNLYITNYSGNTVEKIATGSTSFTISSGFNYPAGIATDISGKIYVANSGVGSTMIAEVVPVGGYYLGNPLPAGLSFNGATGVMSGTPTAVTGAKNYTVTAYNLGGGTAAKVNIKVLAATANADLSSLKLYNGPSLTPSFASNATSYTASVPNATTFAEVTPTLSDPAATSLKVNSVGMVSGTTSPQIPLKAGPNTITTVVVAADGTTTKTYTITVTRAPSSVATLSALRVNNVTLTPAFAAGTVSYTASIANSISSTTVTPTTSDPAATIKVNGTAITSGNTSAAIALNVGLNTITTAVTAQDGATTKTYTVTVTRAPSPIATLSALKISSGTLAPAFASGKIAYTASVSNATASITVTPTATDATATIKVNGKAVTSGKASGAVALNVGTNTTSTVVTAQDGATTDTYTVTVTRAGSGNASLSNLAISGGFLAPAFASGTTSYTASVLYAASTITVTPTTTDATATIKVNGTTVASGAASGAIALNVGSNVITTVVTAQDGVTTKTYTVTVTRAAASNNAYLATINLTPASSLTVVSGPDYQEYTASVSNTTSSVTVTFTTHDPTATVKVNGTTVAAGTPSGPIALSVGPNTITLVSTAQDGVTTKTYGITVTRAAASPASLSALQLSSGTLTPVFATGTTSYTASVLYAASTITVTPTTSVGTATIKVNGTTVASGAASGPIALSVGANTITTVVTNGASTKTYTVTVTRAAASNNAYLATINLTPAASLTVVSGPDYKDYTASVPNTTSSVTVTFTTHDPTATVKVNGTTVASGTASGAIALSVGPNTITVVSTAQDGVTTKTYAITVTRMGPVNIPDATVSVSSPTTSPQLAEEVVVVHPGVSPNGDGIDDYLQIDNITNYPDNKLIIMNRNGMLVYEAKGYDNSSHVFDGHSNKTGQMQLPGTYFYSLDYNINGIIKHKTGFLVLKY